LNNNITEYKSLSDFIKKDNVITIKTVNNKKQLFSKISNLLEHETNFSHSSLSKILLKNENKKPTNIGSGVAIPNIQHNQIKNTNGCFIRLYNSIIYDSFNNDPVDLIFALLSPVESSNGHLRMLAKTSRLLKNLDIQNKLRGAESDEALFEILIQTDLL